MKKGFIYQGRRNKNILVLNKQALLKDDGEPDGFELVSVVDMYSEDIEKVNDFFFKLEELAEAYYHMSPAMQLKFAKLAGEKVRWCFSPSHLIYAGLRRE